MNPDTLAAACHILADQWGSYGYRIEEARASATGGAVLLVAHSDGSRFALAVDRYACHHSHADHQGYEPSRTIAVRAAELAARDAHADQQQRRLAELAAEA